MEIINFINNMEEVEFCEKTNESNISDLDLTIGFSEDKRTLVHKIATIQYKVEAQFNVNTSILLEQIGDILSQDDVPFEIDFFIYDGNILSKNEIAIINDFENITEYQVTNKIDFIKAVEKDGLIASREEIVIDNIHHYGIKNCPFEFLDVDYIVNHDNDYIFIDDDVYFKIEAIDYEVYEELNLIVRGD